MCACKQSDVVIVTALQGIKNWFKFYCHTQKKSVEKCLTFYATFKCKKNLLRSTKQIEFTGSILYRIPFPVNFLRFLLFFVHITFSIILMRVDVFIWPIFVWAPSTKEDNKYIINIVDRFDLPFFAGHLRGGPIIEWAGSGRWEVVHMKAIIGEMRSKLFIIGSEYYYKTIAQFNMCIPENHEVGDNFRTDEILFCGFSNLRHTITITWRY